MPCDSITTQSINLRNAIGSILADSLSANGWTVQANETERVTAYNRSGDRVSWVKGKGLTLQGRSRQEQTIQDITKGYSKQAVSWAAKRAGWTVKETGNNTLTVNRR